MSQHTHHAVTPAVSLGCPLVILTVHGEGHSSDCSMVGRILSSKAVRERLKRQTCHPRSPPPLTAAQLRRRARGSTPGTCTSATCGGWAAMRLQQVQWRTSDQPTTLGSPCAWFSPWNWITSSIMGSVHTHLLPSSLHVAQWDSLGLKIASFTCRAPQQALDLLVTPA